jgi:hypothetical protein
MTTVEAGIGVFVYVASPFGSGPEIAMSVGAGVGIGTAVGMTMALCGMVTVGFETGVKAATADVEDAGCVSGRTNGDCGAPCVGT